MSRGAGAEYSFYYFALALFSAFCMSADALVSVESSSREHNPSIEIVENQVAPSSDASQFSSWEACINATELARSNRDLKFFISAAKLSDAKPWFVSHSRANEARFCYDVFTCEQAFENTYSDVESGYPPC